jgi:hypothetical protein
VVQNKKQADNATGRVACDCLYTERLKGRMSAIAAKSRFRAQFAILLFSIAYSTGWGQGVDCPPGCSPGRWSKEAVDLSSVRSKAPFETRDIRVLSPDKQKIAHIVKDRWWIEIGES